MHFTEDMFEQAVIELFENMGYTHIYAPDMERDYSSPLLDSVLMDSLVKLNKGLPLDAITEAINKLRNFDAGSLLQKNMQFMDYLQNGIPVRYFVKGEERTSIVYLIDYKTVVNKQIAFVHKIINHVEQNGYMENVTELQKPPFDKPISFVKLFDPRMRAEIMAAINKV